MAFMYNNSYRRRQFRRKADINITNLMDIMMVLLVVFMVAAPLMSNSVRSIIQSSDGYYYIGKNVVEDDKILAKLQAIKGENDELTVTISGDTDAHYGRVIGLMAILKEAGYEKVGLKTESKPLGKAK